MELLVILAYAGLLALVAPFVLPKSDFYGNLVPFGVALTTGSIIWLVFTWFGFNYQEAWIWFAAMIGMPIAVWFTAQFLSSAREAAEFSELQEIRLRGKA